MVSTALSLILIGIAGIFDALKDKSEEGRFNNPNLNKANTWRNKWANVETREEKFLGSSTIFVFLTDFWHLMKWCQYRCIDTSIVLAAGWDWYFILIIPVIRGICFEYTHK